MKKTQKVLFQKAISVISGLVLVVRSLTPGFFVYAQETTPEPTVAETPIPTPVTTPEPTQTDIVSPTPSEEITPTTTPENQQNEIGETPAATPTDIVSPTPSEDITPTIEPTETNGNTTSTEEPKNNSPPADDSKGEILDGVSTTAPTANPTVEPVEGKKGDLQAVILKNVEAPTLNLDGVNPDGSAQLSTDKADYAPTDTAIITGIHFTPGKTYQLIISSSDNPPTSTTISITADSNGSFIYAYQLDGMYRPNYLVKAINNDIVISTITFTDGAPCVPYDNYGIRSSTGTDNHVLFNFYSSDKKVDISAEPGYTITEVWLKLHGSSIYVQYGSTAGNYDPEGNIKIDSAKVRVQKFCSSCGNSNVETGETCDNNFLSCTTTEGYSGSQSCNTSCNGWNSCITTESCGDGIKNGNEECDETDLGNLPSTDFVCTKKMQIRSY